MIKLGHFFLYSRPILRETDGQPLRMTDDLQYVMVNNTECTEVYVAALQQAIAFFAPDGMQAPVRSPDQGGGLL